jgi:hypothetical protein
MLLRLLGPRSNGPACRLGEHSAPTRRLDSDDIPVCLVVLLRTSLHILLLFNRDLRSELREAPGFVVTIKNTLRAHLQAIKSISKLDRHIIAVFGILKSSVPQPTGPVRKRLVMDRMDSTVQERIGCDWLVG